MLLSSGWVEAMQRVKLTILMLQAIYDFGGHHMFRSFGRRTQACMQPRGWKQIAYNFICDRSFVKIIAIAWFVINSQQPETTIPIIRSWNYQIFMVQIAWIAPSNLNLCQGHVKAPIIFTIYSYFIYSENWISSEWTYGWTLVLRDSMRAAVPGLKNRGQLITDKRPLRDKIMHTCQFVVILFCVTDYSRWG